jgi:thiol-disulfide isomerase/thioredoxin
MQSVPCNKEFPMFHRRTLLAIAASFALIGGTAQAAPAPYSAEAFAAAQKAGKPILVEITAPWCPTCHAQKPILSSIEAEPAFKDLVVLDIDFDSQKDLVRNFGARMQSTLIVFKGATETGRSTGETNADNIKALLNKAL